MQDAHSTASAPQPESPASRILWTLLIAATLYVCYFSNLGVLGFVGPDEPRYAWIARAMAETGDWVTPRLYGQPWFEKPVLYYWEAAVSFKVFGVSEAAARLPSAFSALLGTLALAWLAWRIYGRDTARWFLIFLPSSVGMIGFSHAAATDMPFAGMITVAMACAAVCLRLAQNEQTPILPRTPWLGLVGFGVFLGLAVLAKGPAAIILCGGATFIWAMFTKRWREAFRLLHPVAILAFCVTALPWYVLCARRNPDFVRIFIIEHNFKRYLTPEFQHVQPFWYYVPVLLVAFLPWVATLLWSAIIAVREYRRTRQMHDATLFFLCWCSFCVVFFSTSHSKLPGYILPAFPAIGLLVARSVTVQRRTNRATYGVAFFIDALLLFLAIAYVDLISRIGFHGSAPIAGTAGLVLPIFALANLFSALFTKIASIPRPVFAVLTMLVAVVAANAFAPKFFQFDPSGRTIARELAVRHIPGNQLFVAGMNRSLRYGVSFYLHDEVREWGTST
ncbi:MAG TPA: phospholipid carrier-dependent glycosyltransferase, partial [Candidatus Dormibacteraeota bacterium]|nr:phospholipid carrier-dependent glycosyltransferase [Candidatus Dormibacteraeota bacterium]